MNMDSSNTESCGRCAMTAVIDTTNETGKGKDRDRDGDGEDEREHRERVFGAERIEVDSDELRIASTPAVVAGRMKHRLNELVTQFVYG